MKRNQEKSRKPGKSEHAEEKISRREWLHSAAKASLIATGVSSVVASEAPAYPAEQQMSDKPFDIHHHLDAPIDDSFSETRSMQAQIQRDYDIRVKIMDGDGIGQAVISAATRRYRKTEGIVNTKKLNDLVAAYVAKHSDRFPVGVGTVEPTHGEASLDELERMAKELKLRGVVWHHTNCGVPIDDPFMRPILRKTAELQLVPVIHVMTPPAEAIWMLETLAEEFPNITFVALDALCNQQIRDMAFLIAKRRPNILFDTGPFIAGGDITVRRFVQQIGADRLLFGSDLYASSNPRHLSPSLFSVRSALITEEERAKILFGNTRKLFRL